MYCINEKCPYHDYHQSSGCSIGNYTSKCGLYISDEKYESEKIEINDNPDVGNIDCLNGGLNIDNIQRNLHIKDIDSCRMIITNDNEIHHIGIKYDKEKSRWDLLPWKQLSDVVDILTFGAKKYSDDNWKNINNHKQRYFSAAMRHLTAWFCGEKNDSESGKSHLAHVICCLLFLMWFDDNEKK